MFDSRMIPRGPERKIPEERGFGSLEANPVEVQSGKVQAFLLGSGNFRSGLIFTSNRLSLDPNHELALDPLIRLFFPDRKNNQIPGGVTKDGDQTSVVCKLWQKPDRLFLAEHCIIATNYFASAVARAIKENREIIANWANSFRDSLSSGGVLPKLEELQSSNAGIEDKRNRLNPQSVEVVWKTLTKVATYTHESHDAKHSLQNIAKALRKMTESELLAFGPDGANASYLGFTRMDGKLYHVTYVKGAKVLGGNQEDPLKGEIHGSLVAGNVATKDLYTPDCFETARLRHAKAKLGDIEDVIADTSFGLQVFEGNNQQNLARIVTIPDFNQLVEKWHRHAQGQVSSSMLQNGGSFDEAIKQLDPAALALVPVGAAKADPLSGARIFALTKEADGTMSVSEQPPSKQMGIRPYFAAVLDCFAASRELLELL